MNLRRPAGANDTMTTPPVTDSRGNEISSLLERIQRVLDEHVRPGMRTDGGDLELVGIDEDRIVQVRLLGACQGCASSVYTLTMFAEKLIKAEIPEVRFLEAVP